MFNAPPRSTAPSHNRSALWCAGGRLASDVLVALSGVPAAGEQDRELFSFVPGEIWRMKCAEIMSACSVSTGILRFGMLERPRNFQDVSAAGAGACPHVSIHLACVWLVSRRATVFLHLQMRWHLSHGSRVKHAAELCIGTTSDSLICRVLSRHFRTPDSLASLQLDWNGSYSDR